MSKERVVSLFFDSGAFSAWNKGEQIEIKDYIAFIKTNRHLIDSYVCLDTIPGSMGRMDRSQASIEKSAAASYRNQQVMRDAGLAPIPVFHQGERYEWLEKYLSDGEPYIGISPYMRSTQDALINWLDQCFTRVTDCAGRPLVKTHGFGMTAHEAIWRYPWHSVDSTTWAIAPSYGMLVLPAIGPDGKPDLRLQHKQYHIGDGDAAWTAGRCFGGFSNAEFDWAHKFAKMCGTSVTAFRNDQYARTSAYIMYFKLLEERRGEVHFAHRRGNFFASPTKSLQDGTSANVSFRVIFATQLSNKQSLILTRFNISNRLLSYYEARTYKNATERLEQYVVDGHMSSIGQRSRVDVGADVAIFEPAVRVNWKTTNYKDFRCRRLVGRFMSGSEDEQETTT